MSPNIALFALVSGISSTPDVLMEEMIVTGSRTLERIDEVPASVSVVNSDTLREELKTSPELQNILAIHVPGFGAATGSTSNAGLTLRGRGALVMIDGVPQSTPLRNGSLGVRSVDSSALERIEVIKGATSMYGNGASGGIINYITKSPAADTTISGDFGVSSRFSLVDADNSFSKRFDGSLSGTFGNFSYAINGVYDSRGQQKDADGDTLGLIYGLSDLDTKNLFTKLAYEFDEEKRLQLTHNFYDSRQSTDLVDLTGDPATGVKTQAVENTEGTSRPGAPQGPKDNSNLILNYVDDAIFNHTRLTLDAYRQSIENVFFFSTNLANPDAGYDGGQSLIKSEKQGVRINFKSSFSWNALDTSLLYGVDILNDISSQPLTDGRLWVPEMDMDNRALYLQGKWVWDNRWVLKAGVRNEHTDIAVEDYSTLRLCRSATQCSVSVEVAGGELDYQSTTYNIGLRYTGNDLFNPFIAYSEGFDISDLGRLLRTAQVTDIAQIHTEASIVEHYEVGFSSELDQLKIEFAAYQSESELGTGTQLDPQTGIFLPIREPQRIHGYELAVHYLINETLSLGGSYTYVEGENVDTDKPLTGRYISPAMLSAYLDWQPTTATRLALSYQHIGERDKFEPVDGTYAINEGPVKSYQLLNARGSYTLRNWDIYASVENLLNEDYFPARAQSIVLASYYTKGLGRTATIGVTYRF